MPELEINDIKEAVTGAVAPVIKSMDDFKKDISKEVEAVEAKVSATEAQSSEFKKGLEEFSSRMDEFVIHLQKQGGVTGEDGEIKEIEAKYTRQFADFICGRKSQAEGSQLAHEYAVTRSAIAEKQGNTREVEELKSFATDSHATGGVLVPVALANRIVEKQRDYSPVRNEATVLTTSVGNLSIPAEGDDFGAGWVGEREARNADDAGTFDEVELENVEGWVQVPVTNKMQRNSGFDILGWVATKAASKLSRLEGAGFVTGTGGKQPKGFMTYAAGTTFNTIQQVTTETTTTIGYDDFIEIETQLRGYYRPGSKYFMNRFIQGYVRKIKDGDSRPYYPNGREINGYSTVLFDDMAGESSATLTADDLVIGFGNLRESYAILDHTASMTVIVDPLSNRTSGTTIYQFTKVTGGGIIDFDAFKIMKVKS